MEILEPYFSIIIPTYNRAHSIHKAINSILSQTFQNFEIIIIDDASNDNTEEVIKNINASRVFYYRNEKNLVGSDQAWIQVVLGNNESLFTEVDGIYDYSFLPDRKLPLNAKMIFFPGKVDPSQEKDKNEWVAKHWG